MSKLDTKPRFEQRIWVLIGANLKTAELFEDFQSAPERSQRALSFQLEYLGRFRKGKGSNWGFDFSPSKWGSEKPLRLCYC